MAVITGLAVLAYVVTVYLIFFLTYTPIDIDHVRGVQGRYFVVALPMAAIFLASMTNVDFPRGVRATVVSVSVTFSKVYVVPSLTGHRGVDAGRSLTQLGKLHGRRGRI